MCTGMEAIALAGMAASAAGTGYQAYSQNQAMEEQQEARKRQMEQELQRQQEYQQETSKALSAMLDQFEAPKQKQALENETERRQSDMAQAIQGQDEVDVPISGNAPEVVRQDAAKSARDATQRAVDQSKLLGRLGAYGGVQQGNNILMNRTGNYMDQIGNFSRASSNLNQYEQQAAANSVGQPFPIGDILAGAGSAASMYGLSGGFGGGGSSSGGAYGGVGPSQQYGSLQKASKGYSGGIGF
jgi:membrane-associated HD superfamily phosphohydrolase